MIIPDLNLLLYAYDSTSSFNEKAVTWLQSCFLGTERFGFPHVVLFGFVRLATSRRVFQNPMSVSEVAGVVREWLSQPVAEIIGPGSAHVENVFLLLEAASTGGNLVTDAQIAALAIEHRAVLHTADSDFQRFPGLSWFNPLTGAGKK